MFWLWPPCGPQITVALMKVIEMESPYFLRGVGGKWGILTFVKMTPKTHQGTKKGGTMFPFHFLLLFSMGGICDRSQEGIHFKYIYILFCLQVW